MTKSRLNLYILNGHKPAEESDLIKWATWFETADRHVCNSMQGDVRVSTVFLGLDHGWGGRLELFETMAFVGHEDVGRERYATWAQAEEGHARWVAKVFKATPILTIPKATK